MKAEILSGTLDSIIRVVQFDKGKLVVDQEDKNIFVDRMTSDTDNEIAIISSESLFHRSSEMVSVVHNYFRTDPLWPRWLCPIFGLESMYINVPGCTYCIQLVKDHDVVGLTYNCVDEDAAWAWFEALMEVK